LSELRKTINVWHGIALAVGMVVGSGLLGLPGLTLEVGGVHAAAAGWLLTSAAAVPLIWIFCRLGLKFTSSAGLTLYAKRAAGEWAGHAVTAVLLGTFVIGIPALALIGAAYTQHLVGLPPMATPWLAVAILGVTTAVNLLGVRIAGWVNAASLVALVLLVAVVVLLNPDYCVTGLSVLPELARGQVQLRYQDLWQVCVLLFWAYLGWENLSFGLEEFRRPARTIPLVYWGSFAVVAVLYLALAFTSIGAAASGQAVAGASGLVALVSGSWAGRLLVGVMVLVILANANAWVFGASRLLFAAGRDGVVPPVFARLSAKDVPWVSLLALCGAYAVVIAATSATGVTVSTLIPLVSQNFLVLYAFSIVAFFRSERGWERWVVTPLALVMCVFFLSGFSWWAAYPAALLALGYLSYRRTKVADRQSQMVEDPEEVHA
jgi:amino acid transporter